MATHHVIIGGGPVATNALETIRALESAASRITLVCDEPAHSRMALPYWLSGQFPREHTYTADEALFRRLQVEARIGARVRAIDPERQTVTLEGGESLAFDKLLIATGAAPLALSIPGAELTQPLWSLADVQQLLDATPASGRPRVVLIGGGFIGLIMLAAMVKRNWQLAVVERQPHVLPRMLPAAAAAIVEPWLRGRGVALYCGTTVQAVRPASGSAKLVELADGQTLEADVVIVAAGIRPNDQLARQCGLATDAGILVDDRMQTNVPAIYAGGDVAQGPVLFGDQPAIHAIQPTAVDHGRVAGANMAGREIHYPGSLSMNVLDACGLQCASFGNWSDAAAAATTIANPASNIYRSLHWHDDELVGAVFVGRANDVGMLTDVGMVKGILQTRTRLGAWQRYLADNPFDIRRPYVATNVAGKLAATTLLGQPARPRSYRGGSAAAATPANPHHELYVSTKQVAAQGKTGERGA